MNSATTIYKATSEEQTEELRRLFRVMYLLMQRIERLNARVSAEAVRFQRTRLAVHEDRQIRLQQLASLAQSKLVFARQRFWKYARLVIPELPIGGQFCQWIDADRVFVHVPEVG